MSRAYKTSSNYKLSFTAASLSLTESIKIAGVYNKCRDWDLTKSQIVKDNLLQSRTNSRTIRTSREIIQRLESLNEEQLLLLVDGNIAEQKYVLWFAVCKTYNLISEFAIEVVHERYLNRSMKVTELDYDAFFNRKADWNPELDQITTTTRKKIRQVVFRMMREADLITEDNTILQAMLSRRLVQAIKPDAPMSFQIFPIQPSDVQG